MKSLQLEHQNVKRIFTKGKPYTLSLGAGICVGIIPNWEELTFKVLSKCLNPKLEFSEYKEIGRNLGWSLDSLLQASLNYLVQRGGDIDEFNNILKDELYASINAKASVYGLENALKKFISDPFKRNNNHILKLYDFFEKEYKQTSLFQVAEFLLKASEMGYPPKAVLTFNADVLLHSLLTLMQLKREYDKTGKTDTAKFKYKAVHNVIGSDGHKVPIYHVHGSIVPNGGSREARHNLVFPESSYHDVSGSTYSWQQSIFQYYALRTRMVFIGLSMSDPNIRRWLSHVNSVLNRDIYNMTGREENVAIHMWVTPQTNNKTEHELKKLGLQHLGVKVAEIESWSRLQPALLNLIE